MARAGSLAIKTHAKAFDGSGRAREGKRGGVEGGGVRALHLAQVYVCC